MKRGAAFARSVPGSDSSAGLICAAAHTKGLTPYRLRSFPIPYPPRCRLLALAAWDGTARAAASRSLPALLLAGREGSASPLLSRTASGSPASP